MTSVTVQVRPPGGGEQTEASSGQQDKPGVPPIRAMLFSLLVTAGVGGGGYLFAQQQGSLAAQSTTTQQGIEIAELRRQVTALQTTLAQERLRSHLPTSGPEAPRNSATIDAVHAQSANSDQPQEQRGRLTSGRWVGRWASTPISLVFAKSGMVVQSRAQQIWETPGDDADNSWALEGHRVTFPVFFVETRNDNTQTPIRAVPRRAACVFEATIDGDQLNGISSGCGTDVHLTRQ